MTHERQEPPPVSDGAVVPGPALPRGTLARATFWTLGGEAASHTVRVLSSLILTRLLFPDDFGLMALVQGFLLGLKMFSDLGIWSIIIRHERGDEPRFLNTVWTVSVLRGALLGLAACAIAWPVAAFYDLPKLAYILPAAGLTLLLDGFLSTKFFLYDRRLSKARPMLINLASSISALVFMVAWAWMFRSVWALVWGGVVGTLVRVLLSHLALPGPGNRFQWDGAAWREVAQFGKWVFFNSAVTFLALQLDRFLFAKLIPLWMLGVYSIALNILQLPTTAVGAVATGVALPAFSRSQNHPSELSAMFDRMRLLILLGGGACISFLIFNGPWLMALLYDPRYEDAGWILQVAALGGWFLVLEASHGAMLLTLGQPRWLTLASASKIAAMAVVVPPAFLVFDFPGALVAISAVEGVRYFLESRQVRKAGLGDRRPERAVSLVMLGGAALAMLIQHGPWMPAGPVLRAVLCFTAFLAVWLPIGLWYLGKLRRTA